MDPAIAKFLGVMLSLAAAGVATYAGIVIVNGVAGRLKGRGEPDVSPEELEYLRDRADQVEGLADRVAELETRLDFAERLLPRPEEARHDTPAGSV
jgi:hypothetical protein